MHAFLSSHSYRIMPCHAIQKPESVNFFLFHIDHHRQHIMIQQGAEMQSTKFYMRIHHENQKLFDVGGDDCDVSCDKEAPG